MPDREALQEIEPWDSDHVALVHVLWAAQREGRTLEKADELAEWIMTSRWMKAVRLHARVPDEQAIERAAEASRAHQEADVGWHAESSTYAVYFLATGEVVTGYESADAAAADVHRLVARAVLAAALEQPDAGP